MRYTFWCPRIWGYFETDTYEPHNRLDCAVYQVNPTRKWENVSTPVKLSLRIIQIRNTLLCNKPQGNLFEIGSILSSAYADYSKVRIVLIIGYSFFVRLIWTCYWIQVDLWWAQYNYFSVLNDSPIIKDDQIFVLSNDIIYPTTVNVLILV